MTAKRFVKGELWRYVSGIHDYTMEIINDTNQFNPTGKVVDVVSTDLGSMFPIILGQIYNINVFAIGWSRVKDSSFIQDEVKYGTVCSKCNINCPDAIVVPNFKCWACTNGF